MASTRSIRRTGVEISALLYNRDMVVPFFGNTGILAGFHHTVILRISLRQGITSWRLSYFDPPLETRQTAFAAWYADHHFSWTQYAAGTGWTRGTKEDTCREYEAPRLNR
ncbi:hypothetical protein N7522_005626 [Penicillium canescens]|uniref:Uncharacterized protein n=1 Tax=Penicillium canescens TaxID=5083 RepID=A0AAD6NBQ4_PENCN|nr:uncharacterized protein N7446_011751 [Penicillium canescens]KAJ6003981.1 hypothetical protein N7522_005626 [Penicillium canescens]KAJ6028909.1 hypothetical protein N7444_011896 [Penicillium canescens]KAJ6047343.1 hypothetical protein N7460_003490 [Penicillium canescens]KAJ6049068.1 hypothetical protein N7446_011751 [Penicillium canescens]